MREEEVIQGTVEAAAAAAAAAHNCTQKLPAVAHSNMQLQPHLVRQVGGELEVQCVEQRSLRYKHLFPQALIEFLQKQV